MSHAKLVERATKLRDDAKALQDDAAQEGNHDVRDAAKRVHRVLSHNSISDHYSNNEVVPTTTERR